MTKDHNAVIRSWKDERFREMPHATLEPSPVGIVELDDAFLLEVSGDASTEHLLTWGCCSFGTWNPLSPLDTNGTSGTIGCCKITGGCMNKETIIKAWKNEQYRHTLSLSEQAELPVHPAGVIELDDTFLGNVSAGDGSIGECPTIKWDCLISFLVGTCSPGGSLGCCSGIAPNLPG